tara:strand:- start:199 stop:549 length:351 start_codon:yes stop_codon:yes gene_type:complete
MKLLLDENISYRLIKKLKSHFTEIISVNQIYPLGIADKSIWKYAQDKNYSILTFDSDFQELAAMEGAPPKIILLRPGNLNTSQIATLIESKMAQITNFIESVEWQEIACLVLEENV